MIQKLNVFLRNSTNLLMMSCIATVQIKKDHTTNFRLIKNNALNKLRHRTVFLSFSFQTFFFNKNRKHNQTFSFDFKILFKNSFIEYSFFSHRTNRFLCQSFE